MILGYIIVLNNIQLARSVHNVFLSLKTVCENEPICVSSTFDVGVSIGGR